MPETPAPSGKERRLDERTFEHSHVIVRRLNGEDEFSAQVMNISDGGVRLVCKIPIDAEERVEFTIDDKIRTARVLGSTELFDGFAVRAEFIL